MYQEVSKRQKLSWKHIGAGILSWFGILFLMNGVAYLGSLHSAWWDLITFFMFSYSICFTSRIFYYLWYILIDDEFIIHQGLVLKKICFTSSY